jgi:hypothetical protein
MKQCSKCKETKPYSDFYKCTGKTQHSADGYRWQCKKCHLTNPANTNPATKAAYSRKSYLKRKAEDPVYFMWRQAKHRAKWDYNNLEFSITQEDIIIPNKCPYMQCDFIPLDKDYGYSLDRIDSSKGYTKDNIQVITRIANIMKNNATTEQLIQFAKGVLSVHQGGLAPC